MKNEKLTLALSLIVSSVFLFVWLYFFDTKPNNQSSSDQTTATKIESQNQNLNKFVHAVEDKESIKSQSTRIKIETDKILGSVSLAGPRLDDISLTEYKENTDENSKNVDLLIPSGVKLSEFIEFGWYAKSDYSTETPNKDTVWQKDNDSIENETINKNSSLNLTWTNKENVTFKIKITYEADYMFVIEQSVTNNSDKAVSLRNYGLINKAHEVDSKSNNSILHQGAVGVVNGSLEEYSYEKIKDDKLKQYKNQSINWFGITDKYWLVSIMPEDQSLKYDLSFRHAIQNNVDKIQADFTTPYYKLSSGDQISLKFRTFVGPKKVSLLDYYENKNNIKLFDRAVDFGWLYIITKPLFIALTYINEKVGNFGISILIITVLIKLLMFGITNKSYKSVSKMKKLQPKIDAIKTTYASDKMKLNQKILELYKQEKVNPFGGILSLFIQIPVFFAIYKVLYVTIEMRHAPFYGWIKDLSAEDPTNIFNLFGLLSFTPPSFMHIGVLPIIMSLSMYVQQKFSPQPADATQAQVMKFLPLFFLFMFSSFPAGLLIYWTWSNILSIIQQYLISND